MFNFVKIGLIFWAVATVYWYTKMEIPMDAFAFCMVGLAVIALFMPNVQYSADETRKASPFALIAIILMALVAWAFITATPQEWKEAKTGRAAEVQK